MLLVNEKSTLVLELGFHNELDEAVVPGPSRYRLDDYATGTEILGWTDFVPSASTHDLTIPAAQNAVINSALPVEKKRLTLDMTFSDDGKKKTGEFIYAVRNLAKIE